tara:strand:- start:35 stop:490 length:456 start_codon:yes stop_codon:yes gene_type:complete
MAKGKLIRGNIEIRKSPIHRYGVFAKVDIKKGTIIEEAPSVILKGSIPEPLDDYAFGISIQENTYSQILAFGYASMINHSDKPNTDKNFDKDNEILILTAIKDIKKDEEVLHNYGKDWFRDREAIQILDKLEDNFYDGKLSIDDLRKILND